MVQFQKIGVAAIVLVETLVFCYAPEITKRISIYRSAWFNEKTLNNATSGALLSLALTHLLPEGFGEDGKDLILGGVDIRGFVMGMPILLLVTIDFLAGHHCGSHSVVDPGIKSLNSSNITNVIDEEMVPMENFNMALSHVSTDHDYKHDKMSTNMDHFSLKLKQLFTSRALYLLLTFYGHSVLEGALLGAQDNAGSLWGMAFGICAHKWAECLVLNSTVTNLMKNQVLRNLCSIAFALCVPVGILMGTFVLGKSKVVHAIFQLLAIGFFLYLSFELLTHHSSKMGGIARFPLWASYLFGSTLMAVILVVVEIVEMNSHKAKSS
ncbi:Zn transporter [Babesia ovis]|uniref:Zn transporter n=1 Tax=Babesia ovis TaxID=5869 RepID=A0A9W5TCS5_BABOV|nr:Zn transporter [Babesia ovis]